MERQCWICFNGELETPATVRWISPCRCTGDTQWSHEPCLFSWIIRKQAERVRNGERVAVIIHEDSTFSQQHDQHIGFVEGELGAERMQTRLQMIAEYGDHLIKCPQCHSPYEIHMEPRGMLTSFWMDLYQFVAQTGEYLVPYVAVAGGTYLFVAASSALGMYLIVTVCGGADDLVASHLVKADRWSWREWLGVCAAPYWLFLFKSRVTFSSTVALGLLSAITAYGVLPELKRRSIISDYPHSLFPPVYDPTELPLIPIRELVSRRIWFMFGMLGVKYLYAIIHDSILRPMIVQSTIRSLRRPRFWLFPTRQPQINPAAYNSSSNQEQADDLQFTEYLTVDMVEPSTIQQQGPATQEEQEETSLFSMGRKMTHTVLLPVISSFTGSLLQSTASALVSSGILLFSNDLSESTKYPVFIAPVKCTASYFAWIHRVLVRSLRFDRFVWTFIGGCVFTVTRDLINLFYNRLRSQQRKRMRVLNYRST